MCQDVGRVQLTRNLLEANSLSQNELLHPEVFNLKVLQLADADPAHNAFSGTAIHIAVNPNARMRQQLRSPKATFSVVIGMVSWRWSPPCW